MEVLELSVRQQAVQDEWLTTDNNILISAVAGSGKTSTLMMLLEHCKFRTLILAFNKSIQQELTEKMVAKGLDQGKAMTMHSLGLLYIKKAGISFKIESNKNWNLVNKLRRSARRTVNKIEYSDRAKVMYSLTEMNDVSRMYLTDDLEEIKGYMRIMDKIMPASPHLGEVWGAFLLLRQEAYEQNTIEIDFLDMIYIPVIRNLENPIYPAYIFIDEAQDLSLLQHKLFDMIVSTENIKKWVSVGDPKQSIYAFAGATSDSFDRFKEKGNTIELPLDICYRCATTIVAKANEVYDIMEAGTDRQGIVREITDVDLVEDGSLIICRNSSPLISVYFKLLAQGKSCYINGSEIMYFLIRFLGEYKNHNVRTAKVEMGYKIQDLGEDTSDKGQFELFIMTENYNNFCVIASHMFSEMDSINTVIASLKELFKKKPDSIMLCTIHKSKGLEADTVYILEENLIPSKFAKSPEQMKQEKNLKYVARTRAKNKLYFLNLKQKE